MLAYCHFHSLLILHFIYYISQRRNAKNCIRITGYSVKIRSQVHIKTCAILPGNQSPSVSNSQRGWSWEQIFDRSTTFLDPLVGTNSLYGKRTVGFFLLSSHALTEARALCARKALTPRYTDVFTDFEQNNRLFCSLLKACLLVEFLKNFGLFPGLVSGYSLQREDNIHRTKC